LYETVNTYGTRVHQQLEAYMTDPVNEYWHRCTAITDRNAATAAMTWDGLTVTGSSKRNPEDEHLPAVGEDLAFADLFEKLSVKLRKRAQGRVNTFENNRSQRRASAARKALTITAGQEAQQTILLQVTGAQTILLQDGRTMTVFPDGSTSTTPLPA
jgi:uncharacterized protein DUF1876